MALSHVMVRSLASIVSIIEVHLVYNVPLHVLICLYKKQTKTMFKKKFETLIEEFP